MAISSSGDGVAVCKGRNSWSYGDSDIIRLFNARGACLAAVRVTDSIAPGIVQLPTGAWYDPMDPEEETPLCVHGNPNVLTRDVGTSSFAQGCTGKITTVQVERFNGNLPPIRALIRRRSALAGVVSSRSPIFAFV